MANAGTAPNSAPSGRKPRVLTVLPDFPFPATTGLHLRHASLLELIHRLGCYSALLYFTTEEREPPSLGTTPLARICDEVCHGGRRFRHSDFSTASLVLHKADFLLRGMLGLPGKRYPFSMSYDRIGAAAIVLAEARRVQADFVVLPGFMLHYAAELRANGFRVIADAIDVLSELSARLLACYGNNLFSGLGLYSNHVACEAQERIYLPKCSEVWATSSQEAETLSRIAPDINVLVVPNCLDEFAFQPGHPASNPTVGFIGTYSSFPNLQAARFLAEMFPAVLREHPRARLKLAGAGLPSEEEKRFRSLGYVDILGAVAQSEDFYEQCCVVALPVFVRGGVPLKLVESLAREKPVVACSETVAGLDVRDGHDVLVREGVEDFAQAVSLLLADDSLRLRLARNGRDTFMRNWSLSRAESTMQLSSLLAQSQPGKN